MLSQFSLDLVLQLFLFIYLSEVSLLLSLTYGRSKSTKCCGRCLCLAVCAPWLLSFVREAFVNKQHTVAIFFDLEKAYDTTWKYGIMKDLSVVSVPMLFLH